MQHTVQPPMSAPPPPRTVDPRIIAAIRADHSGGQLPPPMDQPPMFPERRDDFPGDLEAERWDGLS